MGSPPSSSSGNSIASSSDNRAVGSSSGSGTGGGASTVRIGTVTVVEEDKQKHMVSLAPVLSRSPCLQGSSLAIPLLAAALGTLIEGCYAL